MRHNRFFLHVLNWFRRIDKILWLLMLAISAFSLLLLKSVSRATNTDYFKTQLVVTIVGLAGSVVFSMIDYNHIASAWKLIACFSVFIMLYTIFFGVAVQGSGGVNARAWINIAGRTFQTSELVKIFFMITYAKHISILREREWIKRPLQVFLLAGHAAIPVLLCHFQGDDGAAIVFFAMFLYMSLAGGVHLRYFIALGLLAALCIPVLWNFVLSEYQIQRFTAVYNLDDPSVQLNEGYQQYQARLSIGSGELTGKGLFNGPRVESNYVTFQHSDFIFSVAGEELGFIGCTAIIVLISLYLIRILYVASKSRDDLGRCMCFGFFGLIALQSISNIGMCLALLPVMGVTLPFFSAGGSSAVCLYLGFGLVQNVYMHRSGLETPRMHSTRSLKINFKKLKV